MQGPVAHVEQGRVVPIAQRVIDGRLGELRALAVQLLRHGRVREGQLVGADAHHGAVVDVELVSDGTLVVGYVLEAAPLGAQLGKKGTRNLAKGVEEKVVYGLLPSGSRLIRHLHVRRSGLKFNSLLTVASAPKT